MEEHSYNLWKNARKCNRFQTFYEKRASGTSKWNIVFLSQIAFKKLNARVAPPQKCSLKRSSLNAWCFLGKVYGGVSFLLIVMQTASGLSVFALHWSCFAFLLLLQVPSRLNELDNSLLKTFLQRPIIWFMQLLYLYINVVTFCIWSLYFVYGKNKQTNKQANKQIYGDKKLN